MQQIQTAWIIKTLLTSVDHDFYWLTKHNFWFTWSYTLWGLEITGWEVFNGCQARRCYGEKLQRLHFADSACKSVLPCTTDLAFAASKSCYNPNARPLSCPLTSLSIPHLRFPHPSVMHDAKGRSVVGTLDKTVVEAHKQGIWEGSLVLFATACRLGN